MNKYLYYNPKEIPEKIRLVSKELVVDYEYDPLDEKKHSTKTMSQCYAVSRLKLFSDVLVYVPTHMEVYYKDGKKNREGTSLKGWVSLKEHKSGGDYLKDLDIERIDGRKVRR